MEAANAIPPQRPKPSLTKRKRKRRQRSTQPGRARKRRCDDGNADRPNANQRRCAFPVALAPPDWKPDWSVPPDSAEEYLRRVHFQSENEFAGRVFRSELHPAGTSEDGTVVQAPQPSSTVDPFVESFRASRAVVSQLHADDCRESPKIPAGGVTRSTWPVWRRFVLSRDCALSHMLQLTYVQRHSLFSSIVRALMEETGAEGEGESLFAAERTSQWLFSLMLFLEFPATAALASVMNDFVDYLRERTQVSESHWCTCMDILVRFWRQKGNPKTV